MTTKQICAVGFAIAIQHACVAFASNHTNTPIFSKSISDNVSICVFHKTVTQELDGNKVNITGISTQESKQWIKNLPESANAPKPDTTNLFTFGISTNHGISFENLWQTAVVSFKNGYFSPSGYVIKDCHLANTNLVVAYIYNNAVCCNVVNYNTHERLSDSDVIVWIDKKHFPSLVKSVKITVEEKEDRIQLHIVDGDNTKMVYHFQNKRWMREY